MENPNNFSFAQKFIGGEVHFAFWKILTRFLSFFVSLIILSSLKVYGYAVFLLILSAYGAMSGFLSMGGGVVSNDLIRFVGEGQEDRAKRLFFEYHGVRLFFGFLFFAVIFFGANSIFPSYGDEFVNQVKVIAFLFIPEIIFSSFKNLMGMRLDFAGLASRTFMVKGVQLAVLVYFWTIGDVGLKEIFISMILGSLFASIFMIKRILRKNKVWFSVGFSPKSEMKTIFMTYGRWDIWRQFFMMILSRIQPWIVKIFVNTEAVAIFGVADLMVGMIKDVIPFNTLGTLIPRIAGEKARIQKVFNLGTKIAMVLSLATCLLSYIFVPPLINSFFPQYRESLPLFYFLLAFLPVSSVSIVAAYCIIALRKQKFLFWFSSSKQIIKVLLDTFLTYSFGLWGLVISSITITMASFFASSYYIVKRKPGGILVTADTFVFSKDDYAKIKFAIGDYLKKTKRTAKTYFNF